MATYSGQVLSSSSRRLGSNPNGLMVSATGTATRISPAAANHLSCWRSTPRERWNRSARDRAAAGRVARNSWKPTWPKASTSQPSAPPVTPTGLSGTGTAAATRADGSLQPQRDRQDQDQPGQQPPAAGRQAAVGEHQQDQRE
jgi:hypothetical protein